MSENLLIKDFKTLKVWQKANVLEQEIGELVKGFPSYEQYRLTDQLVRAVRSIGAYSGVSGRRNRNYPDTKPEHPDTLSIGSILF